MRGGTLRDLALKASKFSSQEFHKAEKTANSLLDDDTGFGAYQDRGEKSSDLIRDGGSDLPASI